MKAELKRRTPVGEAVVNVGLGLVFLAFGGIATTAMVVAAFVKPGPRDPAALVFLPFYAIPLLIALVGLNMVLQGARRAPGIDGFFYRVLLPVGRKFTPWGVWRATLIYALAAVALSALFTGKLEVRALSLVSFIGLLFVHIALHEAGHFVAARVVGFAPHRVVVGPLLLEQGEFWVLRANRDWLFLMGGLVVWESPRAVSRRRRFIPAAAGPAATLALLLLGWIVHALRGSGSGIVEELLEQNQLIGLGTLIINLIPAQRFGLRTDGHVMLSSLSSRSTG